MDDRLLLEALGEITSAIRQLTITLYEAGVGIATEIARKQNGPATPKPLCSSMGCESPRLERALFCEACANDIEDYDKKEGG